jgi:hypothetical protein
MTNDNYRVEAAMEWLRTMFLLPINVIYGKFNDWQYIQTWNDALSVAFFNYSYTTAVL